mgnify:CR=1 FL=1
MIELTVILDHHNLGYLSLWYGAVTLITGFSLLLIREFRLGKKAKYLRLIHFLSGVTTALLGLLTYLAAVLY